MEDQVIIQLHGMDPMRAINIIQSVVAPAEVRALAVARAAVLGMIEETIQMEAHGMEIDKNWSVINYVV